MSFRITAYLSAIYISTVCSQKTLTFIVHPSCPYLWIEFQIHVGQSQAKGQVGLFRCIVSMQFFNFMFLLVFFL